MGISQCLLGDKWITWVNHIYQCEVFKFIGNSHLFPMSVCCSLFTKSKLVFTEANNLYCALNSLSVLSQEFNLTQSVILINSGLSWHQNYLICLYWCQNTPKLLPWRKYPIVLQTPARGSLGWYVSETYPPTPCSHGNISAIITLPDDEFCLTFLEFWFRPN